MATIQDSKLDLLLTPRVPQGLAAVVEGLTREVIRHRPENIYVFAAHHFEKLLHLREQYETTTINKQNIKYLRDINDAVKERCDYQQSKETKDFVRQSGWSLNETAKVLEKHRSIFGEASKKINVDEIRPLTNEPTSIPSQIPTSCSKKKYEASRVESKNEAGKYAIAASTKKKESPHHHSQDTSSGSKSDSRSTPKIIPQIPLVKDIKTELKKNRMSSRERKKVEEKKMQVACEYNKEIMFEKSFKKSIEKTKKILETRNEQKQNLRIGDTIKRRVNTTKDKIESQKIRKTSKPAKMDLVKNYVVKNLVGMARLDDLQTPSYVEKVQDVIDETSMIIKQKVEALKIGVIKAARANQLKSENSSSNDEYLNTYSKSESDQRSIKGNLFRSSSYQHLSKSSESSKIVQDNSENSEFLDNNMNSLDKSESKISDNLDDSNESNISLPAVRPPSSKSTSRSLSARSNSEGLILPPISPESNKSTKVVEELVLPILSPPHSISITPDSINYNEKIVERNQVYSEEEFQDSLNVTPDLVDTLQRPDSLETFEITDKSNSSGHVSPLETLKDKLLEIEEVQKRIEDVLDDTASTNNKNSKREVEDDETKVTSKIQDKLLEIEESEKRIEKILDFQSTATSEPEIINTDIKSKLKELEDVEKRIENIFINETDNEYSNKTNKIKTNIEEINNSLIYENLKNIKENVQKNFENITNNTLCADRKDDEIKKKKIFTEINRALSPHSYVLTEGSPYDIPDSITTVIIPDRCISPDYDTLQIELEDGEICSTLISSKENNTIQTETDLNKSQEEQKISIQDAFGEAVSTAYLETSTVDIDYIQGIKANHDIILTRQDLDLIQEECDKEVDDVEAVDSEDEKVLKVVTSSLEEILEKDKVEYVSKEEIQTIRKSTLKEETRNYLPEAVQISEYDSTDETKETSITDGFLEITEIVENSLDIEETTGRSVESTNEVKETSIITDRSSLSFDPVVPIVPELNLDSLPDLTISSFNITDDEQKGENKNERKDSNSSEVFNQFAEIKEKQNINEESLVTETDVQEIEDNRVNNIDISKEDSLIVSEMISSEFGEQLEEEQLVEKENEKLHESVNFNELDAPRDSQIFEATSIVENENILNSSDSQTKTDDILADVSVNLDIELVSVKNTGDTASDKIINPYNENNQSKEITTFTSEIQNNLLTPRGDNADLSLREFENDPLSIEQNCLCDSNTDQNSQFVDSSRVSSQCTKRLDSDNVLMKTSTDNTIKNNHSQNTHTIKTEQTIDDKTLNNNLQIIDTLAVGKEKVENVTNDEKKHCHIYIPEMSISKDISSSTASSTFMSAATRIQAGVRGFLTRRRLQSSQRRSSTLDSVPSIEESFAAENSIPTTKSASSSSSTSYLMPIVENVSISESKGRKKLSRENAVQRTTLSLENAFADNQIQHTGEFHDCIPLPAFDTGAFSFKVIKEERHRDEKLFSHEETINYSKSSNVEQFFGQMFAKPTTNLSDTSKLGQFVDVVLLPGDSETMLQSRYLNFITSVEDVTNDLFNDSLVLPNSPQGIIIEEITSLDEDKTKVLKSTSDIENESIVSDDVANETKTNDEFSNTELRPESSQEKSNNHTLNVIDTIKNQSSDAKPERFVKDSLNVSPLSAEVKVLDIELFEGEKSNKEANFVHLQKTENEIPEMQGAASFVDASISISDEPVSMNIEEVLGLGDKNDNLQNNNRIMLKSAGTDILKSTSVSQDSHLGDDRTRSPLTMMQIATESMNERSEKSERSENEKIKSSSNDETDELSMK